MLLNSIHENPQGPNDEDRWTRMGDSKKGLSKARNGILSFMFTFKNSHIPSCTMTKALKNKNQQSTLPLQEDAPYFICVIPRKVDANILIIHVIWRYCFFLNY